MTVTTARTSRNRTARSIDVTLTTTIDSPIGPLTLTSVDGDLTGLQMANAAHPPKGTEMWVPDRAAFKEVVGQLAAYFAGELRDFEVPLRAEGTEFQRRVWDGLRQIPFGETWSYGRLAEHVGNVQACRAVGLANGRNPIAVIVPCHRVIGANGTLTGYGGGLDRKAWLLDHERRVRGGTASARTRCGGSVGGVDAFGQAQVRRHDFEHGYEVLPLVDVETPADLLLGRHGQVRGPGQHLPAGSGQLHDPHPPVGPVEVAGHDPPLLQLVEQADHAAGGYLQPLRQHLLGAVLGRFDRPHQRKMTRFEGDLFQRGLKPAGGSGARLGQQEADRVAERPDGDGAPGRRSTLRRALVRHKNRLYTAILRGRIIRCRMMRNRRRRRWP